MTSGRGHVLAGSIFHDAGQRGGVTDSTVAGGWQTNVPVKKMFSSSVIGERTYATVQWLRGSRCH